MKQYYPHQRDSYAVISKQFCLKNQVFIPLAIKSIQVKGKCVPKFQSAARTKSPLRPLLSLPPSKKLILLHFSTIFLVYFSVRLNAFFNFKRIEVCEFFCQNKKKTKTVFRNLPNKLIEQNFLISPLFSVDIRFSNTNCRLEIK